MNYKSRVLYTYLYIYKQWNLGPARNRLTAFFCYVGTGAFEWFNEKYTSHHCKYKPIRHV